MLLSNSRISKNDKITFYEQDILIDDHIYNGNIQISLDIEYVSPGIGVAFMLNRGDTASFKDDAFLFRIGHSDYSIIKSTGASSEIIENGPVVNIKPYQKNLKLIIRKINNKFQMYVNNKLLSNRYLPAQISSFKVGYYGNTGNSINSISIASEIPDDWVVNMSNTNGGYIKFENDKFEISNCSDNAEIEQNNIFLNKCNDNKRYYLRYDKSANSDIKSYVFLGNDDRYDDDEKNILNKDNSFVLKQDDTITIKFKGTVGSISNIQITKNKSDFYIGTDYYEKSTDSSYININLEKIKKINMDATICSKPDDNKYYIIKDEFNSYTTNDIKVKQDIKYNYEININQGIDKSMAVIKNGNEIITKSLSLGDTLFLFNNIDAIISKIEIIKNDGTIINVIGNNIKKQYIPASINSPIIITDDMGEPLDLSSSYRRYNNRYVFTNTEREVFAPSNRLYLERMPSKKLDTVKIYGILKDAKINKSNLMNYAGEGVESLKDYANLYEIINEKDIYSIDKENGLIILTDKDDFYINSKYKEIVVDYLKDDSYSINYMHELDSYEVEISTDKNTKAYFDGAEDINNGFVNVSNYKIFDSKISNDSYIVLRGGI